MSFHSYASIHVPWKKYGDCEHVAKQRMRRECGDVFKIGLVVGFS